MSVKCGHSPEVHCAVIVHSCKDTLDTKAVHRLLFSFQVSSSCHLPVKLDNLSSTCVCGEGSD